MADRRCAARTDRVACQTNELATRDETEIDVTLSKSAENGLQWVALGFALGNRRRATPKAYRAIDRGG